MGRSICAGCLVYDQLDFYQPNSFVRISGVLSTDLSVSIFFNNTMFSWPLISGLNVPDSLIASGFIYFNEFVPSFYSVRFFPNLVGFWRLVFNDLKLGIEIVKEFDVNSKQSVSQSSGLNASFVKP